MSGSKLGAKTMDWGGGGGGGGNLPVIPRGAIDDQQAFDEFGCAVPALYDPATPDPVSPDVTIPREVFMRGDVTPPGGYSIEIWGFRDPDSRHWGSWGGGGSHGSGTEFPSTTIRVREGQIVHTHLDVRRVHTIHHHGIEPTTFNDGVGHTSFEVDNKYTYQWYASQAGTFLYHCHVNTTLHFEMGMYGLLIVDPPEGPGRVFTGGPAYDVEAFWVPDEIDTDYRQLRWDAGRDQCPFSSEDPGLNVFAPQYFLISGVFHPDTLTDPRTRVSAAAGQTILIRTANAGYTVQRFTIQGLDAQVVSIDGRPLVDPYAAPFTVAAGTPFELTTAQRWDLILQPTAPGSYPATVEFHHWRSGELLGVAETSIEVS